MSRAPTPARIDPWAHYYTPEHPGDGCTGHVLAIFGEMSDAGRRRTLAQLIAADLLPRDCQVTIEHAAEYRSAPG